MRTIFVSGVSRGLGLAIFSRLIASDAQPVGIGRTFLDGQTKAASQGCCRLIHCDLSIFEELINLQVADYVRSSTSQLVFINNAGKIDPIRPIGRLDEKSLHSALMVNSFAPMVITNRLVSISRDRIPLKIVNISSGAANRAISGWSAYCSGKAAAQMFFSCLAAERPSVTISNVDPGVMDTDMQAGIRSHGEADFPQIERFKEMQRSGALRDPMVVAKEILLREGLD